MDEYGLIAEGYFAPMLQGVHMRGSDTGTRKVKAYKMNTVDNQKFAKLRGCVKKNIPKLKLFPSPQIGTFCQWIALTYCLLTY
jgi:hypothetical protein